MKKKIFLIALLISSITFAQSSGFNYKALVTNNGNPVVSSIITVKVKLKHGSSVKWYEQHNNVQTDANGIFSLSIGNGTRISGSYTNFADVNWKTFNNMKLTVEVNTGSGFHTLVGDVPFGSMPYAKQAKKADVAASADKLSTTNSSGIYLNGSGANVGIYFKHAASNNFNIYQNGNTLYFASGYADASFQFRKKIEMVYGAKITATASGDADMKAYAYGFVGSDGVVDTDVSSGGFTVSKLANGHFRIVLPGLTSTTTGHKYMVVATGEWRSGSNKVIATVDYLSSGSNAGRSFDVYLYGNSTALVNNSFHFVVYAK
jgi:hypothetical protein